MQRSIFSALLINMVALVSSSALAQQNSESTVGMASFVSQGNAPGFILQTNNISETGSIDFEIGYNTLLGSSPKNVGTLNYNMLFPKDNKRKVVPSLNAINITGTPNIFSFGVGGGIAIRKENKNGIMMPQSLIYADVGLIRERNKNINGTETALNIQVFPELNDILSLSAKVKVGMITNASNDSDAGYADYLGYRKISGYRSSVEAGLRLRLLKKAYLTGAVCTDVFSVKKLKNGGSATTIQTFGKIGASVVF